MAQDREGVLKLQKLKLQKLKKKKKLRLSSTKLNTFMQ